jgi:hypothetical protein
MTELQEMAGGHLVKKKFTPKFREFSRNPPWGWEGCERVTRGKIGAVGCWLPLAKEKNYSENFETFRKSALGFANA